MTALILHGGAGLDPARDYAVELDDLMATAALGKEMLLARAAALEVAVAVVERLEQAGLYIAGKGSSPNTAGEFELDAAVMDGASGRAGAVAGLIGFRSPVRAARAVLEETSHVLLSGPGARAFAQQIGSEPAEADWFKPAGTGEVLDALGTHGTVGCVALDAHGRIATASSTGGTFGKRPGRVGDTPIPGAGLWADLRVGIGCTGVGEHFIESAAAARFAHLIEFGQCDLRRAAADVIRQVAIRGGTGGLIALDSSGAVVVARSRSGLKCALVRPDGEVSAHILWPHLAVEERGTRLAFDSVLGERARFDYAVAY